MIYFFIFGQTELGCFSVGRVKLKATARASLEATTSLMGDEEKNLERGLHVSNVVYVDFGPHMKRNTLGVLSLKVWLHRTRRNCSNDKLYFSDT